MEDPVCAIGMKLQGRRVVFVGAGEVAERRLPRVLHAGADLQVIARAATAEIEKLASAGELRLERREATPEDVAGAFLVFLTEPSPANDELASAARRAGALVNRTDKPDDCDFVLPALSWMNTVHIGVFSESPVLSKWVRRPLERTLGPDFPEFAAAFAEIRDRLRKQDLPQEKRTEILNRLLNDGLYDVYRTSGMKAAMARVDTVAAEYR